MASSLYKNVIKPAWGDIQDTRGSHYVPDMTTGMDVSTLKSNRAKAAAALAYWTADPCTRPNDSFCANKGNGDIVSTLKDMKTFLTAKLKAYDDRLAIVAPAAVVPQPSNPLPSNPTPAPTEVIGAGTTDAVTPDTGTEVDDPADPAETNTDTPSTGTPSVVDTVKSNKPMLIFAGIAALLVIIAIVVAVKRKKS